MSVMFFDVHELGNVARVLARLQYIPPTGERGSGDRAALAAELERYSVANAAAYANFYRGERAEPVTAAEIMRELASARPGNVREGATSLRLFHYNTESETVSAETLHDLTRWLGIVLSALLSPEQHRGTVAA